MKLVTADRRPDGIAARSSQRRRRGQSMARASVRGVAVAVMEVAVPVASVPARAATAWARATIAGMARVPARASRTTSTA